LKDFSSLGIFLQIELELAMMGLSTMRHTKYQMFKAGSYFWADVMGYPSRLEPANEQHVQFLDGLLNGARRRTFRYPNVQFGYAPGLARDKPLIVDLGGVDMLDRPDQEWFVRMFGSAFEIYSIDTTIFSQVFISGYETACRIEERLRPQIADLKSHLSLKNAEITCGKVSAIEEMSMLLASADLDAMEISERMNACIGDMVATE
jgi:hypothetical protein